jgi:NADH:ubiquinone oxidoreductase subunit 2 (subunit N)
MGLAFLLFMVVVLMAVINGRSIHVWLRGRSLAADVAGVSAVLAILCFLLLFWMARESGLGGALLLRGFAMLATIVLTLTSLIACAIARARARASRGGRAWISFLHVPVLAVPLLIAGLITVLELLKQKGG